MKTKKERKKERGRVNDGEKKEKEKEALVCRNPGLNQGPLDLQSNALPTELFRLAAYSEGVNAIRIFLSRLGKQQKVRPMWGSNPRPRD